MKILGEIYAIETIAEGHGIRELASLQQRYGQGNWRKRKGIAIVECPVVKIEWPKCIGTKRTALAR